VHSSRKSGSPGAGPSADPDRLTPVHPESSNVCGGGGGGGDRDRDRYDRYWDDFRYKDKRWAKKTSECESGRDPNAYNSSGPYYGAFQFLKSTWSSSPKSPGGKPTRYNWKTQAVVAVKLKHRDGKGHWPVCG